MVHEDENDIDFVSATPGCPRQEMPASRNAQSIRRKDMEYTEILLKSLLEKYQDNAAANLARPETSFIGQFVIIRSKDAGVFYGVLHDRQGDCVMLKKFRRIWKWAGAFTLSELSMKGTDKPTECKFAAMVEVGQVLGVIEIIPLSPKVIESLNKVVDYVC